MPALHDFRHGRGQWQPGSQPEAGAATSPQTGDGVSMGWCFVLAGSGAFAVLLWVLYRRIGRKKRVKTP